MSEVVEFLSPEWLQNAEIHTRRISTGVPGERVVVFEHSDEDLGQIVHTQLWSDGYLRSWQRGGSEKPDVVIRFELWAAYLWFFERPAAGAELEVLDRDGRVWMIPPTPRQLSRSVSRRLVPGLTFSATVAVGDHPFGARAETYAVKDGMLLNIDHRNHDFGSHVDVSLPFDGAGSFLVGALPFRDLADRSTFAGDVFAFGNLAAVLAPPDVDRSASVAHRSMSEATAALVGTATLRPCLRELEPRTVVP